MTAGTDNQLIVWDYATGRQIREIKDQEAVTALEISTDDRFLFSADTASRVKKWDLVTGKLVFELVAHGARHPEDEEGTLRALDIDDSK